MNYNAINRVLLVLFVGMVGFLASRLRQQPPDAGQDAWFEQAVVQQPGMVLVKFGATWCGPCRTLDHQLDRFESEDTMGVRVVRIDVDERPELAQAYRVSSIPRLFLFRDGKIVGETVGSRKSEALQQWIREHQ